MSEPFIGEIRMVGFNFSPRGWAFCAGQLMSIAQNTALFSLLGTTYGGDGQVTFALPDLRGRLPIHQGQGVGLSSYDIGQSSGTETVTLLSTQIPQHDHALFAAQDGTRSANPANALIGTGEADLYNRDPANPTTMAPQSIAPTGGNQPHANMQPYLGVNFVIAVEGIYPSRS
jgi:microcystin-dependent protein